MLISGQLLAVLMFLTATGAGPRATLRAAPVAAWEGSAAARGAPAADPVTPATRSTPAAARGGGLAGVARSADFRWPLDGVPRPVRRFDPPPHPWLPGHRGVDLAAAAGAVVRAAGVGTVAFAGPIAGRPVITVSHPGGRRTTYEPVRPSVVAGDRVAAGDPLGVLVAGHAGCPAPACLHWGLRDGAEYLDPLALLGLGRIRLLPLARRRALSGAGRVAPAGPRRAGRTPPAGCRSARRAAASRDHPTR